MPSAAQPPARRIRLLAGLALIAAVSGCATDAGLSHAQGEAIIAELKDIHAALREAKAADPPAPRPAPAVRVATTGAPALGRADAPLTLVEFTDFQCPFCKRFHDQTWPELKKHYIDTGKLRYVVLDLPLPFHAQAKPAALAARCAAAQGKYWPLHDALFATAEDALSTPRIRALALAAGVEPAAFDACVLAPATAAGVEASTKVAHDAGITGTPSFVLGRLGGTTVEGSIIQGAQPYDVFAARIDEALAGHPGEAH